MATGQDELSGIRIERLTRLQEFEQALAVQEAVWGFEPVDRVPARLFSVNDMIGGFSLGAWDGDRLVAFLLTLPGRKPSQAPYLHSHMAGVLPNYQNHGIGRRLKLRQRQEALALRYPLIEWTFDPLEVRNAYFNLERLGVIVRRYKENAYGVTSSKLHGALPTDRLVAEWHLASPRVNSIVDAGAPVRKKIAEEIPVPAEAAALRTSDPARARQMQSEVRERFLGAFSQDLTVVGFRRTDAGGVFELSR